MRGSSNVRTPGSWCALILALAHLAGGAEETNPSSLDWHQFRDREGHELEARVLSLSSDWRQVRIERKDGRAFDLTITRLSLDDQQYLREWLMNPDRIQPDSLHLDLGLTRTEAPGERRRLENALQEVQWETSEAGYEIAITNLAREPAANLKLEYCLLIEENVEVMEPEEETSDLDPSTTLPADAATRLWRAHKVPEIRYRFGSIALPPLAFNRILSESTTTLTLDAITTRGLTREAHEDRCAGVLVRVISPDGSVIAEHEDLIRDHSTFDWETFALRRDPREEDGNGLFSKIVVANDN